MKEVLTSFEFIEREGQNAEINWISGAPDAAVVDRLIRTLGRMRETIEPPVPERLVPGVPVPFVHHARFHVWKGTGGPALSIRDPGLGWISIPLDPGAIRYLQEATQNL